MATVQIYQYAVLDIDGRQIRAGSLSEARSVTLGDDECIDRHFKIAPTTAVKIWDSAEDEALGNFDFCWLESDYDVLVQVTTGAGVTDRYFTMELKGSGTAGDPGPALVLGSDDSQLGDGTIDAFTGTASTIQELWIHNESSTVTARVRMIAAT